MNPSTIQQILQDSYPFLQQRDIQLLLEMGEYQQLENKAIIIRSGQNIDKTFFTLRGMVRGYFINSKGDEKNIFLRPEHTLTGAPECLFDNRATKYTFESILESHLLVFRLKKFKAHAEQNPRLREVYIKGLQENIQTLVSRVESLIDLSPAERYEALLQRSPQFFQTAFNKHIANYLGITPVSLSRIIKRRKEE
jgi:Cyclic nucleotide-binding domain.